MSQFTKRAISEAFVELLDEMPLDKIRVKDIAARCGISRNTFYYYYQDIYALLADVFRQEVQRELESAGSPADSLIERFLEGVSFAREHKRAIYHIYNSLSREELERYLYLVTDHIMRRTIQEAGVPAGVSEEDVDKLISFYRFALVGVLLDWVANGMKADIDAYIRRLGFLLEGNIASSLERAQKG